MTKLIFSRSSNRWFPKDKVNLFAVMYGNLCVSKYPSVRELAKECGLSEHAVDCIVRIDEAIVDEPTKEAWTIAVVKFFLNIDLEYTD